MEIWEYFNPEFILLEGGFWILILIIFLETGFFFGFFLPGDSLLFTAGLLCGTGVFPVPIEILITGLSLAAIGGYMIGYIFGKWFGASFRRKNRLFFNKKHLESTQIYYSRYGLLTIMLGRFMPVVRTFAPILAGMVNAHFGKFMLLNIGGALLWAASLPILGYLLGNKYPAIEGYLAHIIIAIIVLSFLPALISFINKRVQKYFSKSVTN